MYKHNLQDCFISKHRTCYVSELRQKVSNILCKHSRVHLFLIHGERLETSDYSILYVVNVKQALHHLLLVGVLTFIRNLYIFLNLLFYSSPNVLFLGQFELCLLGNFATALKMYSSITWI